MARVTVEDCVLQVPNRFELVMLAAHRARALASGAEPTLERDRDKNPVVALREIADQTLSLEGLNESLVRSLQKRLEPDQPEEITELKPLDQDNWLGTAEGREETESEDDSLDEDGEKVQASGDDSALAGGFEDASEPKD